MSSSSRTPRSAPHDSLAVAEPPCAWVMLAIGTVLVVVVGAVVQPITLWLLSGLGSLPAFYGFYILLGGLSALFGMGFSGVMTSVWVVVRELVPPRVAATSLAVVVMFAWFGMGLGGWHGGHAFGMTGSYHRPYLDAVFSGLVNLVIVGALIRRVGQTRARVIPAPHPAG